VNASPPVRVFAFPAIPRLSPKGFLGLNGTRAAGPWKLTSSPWKLAPSTITAHTSLPFDPALREDDQKVMGIAEALLLHKPCYGWEQEDCQ
jgi:hypothetical protein